MPTRGAPRPIRRPDLAELEALALAADLGTVAAAADALHITRAAASKRLRTLETLLGERLLVRSTRGVTLTPAGRTVYAAARRLLAESDALLGQLGRLGAAPGRPASVRFLDPPDLGRSPTVHESLRDVQRLVGEIFHTSPIPLTVGEPLGGAILDVNDAYAELVGIPREEIIGRSFAELDLAADPGEEAAVIDALHSTGSVTGRRVSLLRRDGDRRTVTITAWRTRIDGRLLVFSIFQDSTQQHRAELEMQGLLKVAERSPSYISLATFGGTLSMLNRAGRAIVGLADDADIAQVSPLELGTGEARALYPAIREALERDGVWSGRFDFQHAVSGQAVPTDATIFLMSARSSGTAPLIAFVARPIG